MNIVKHSKKLGWHIDLQTCMLGRLPTEWQGDGIITMLGVNIHDLVALRKRLGCPIVSLNANHPELGFPIVAQDDHIAGEMAAEHLMERGFRNYAYYSYAWALHSADLRRTIFQNRLKKAGYSVKSLLWEYELVDTEDTWANRQEWLCEELSNLPKPLAVFATNDQAAVEIIEACRTLNINVPQEVAVLGMLDIPVFRESTGISLSSIKVDFDEITGIACDLLNRMMVGEEAPTEEIIRPPVGIAVRNSTDTVAAKMPEVRDAIHYMLEHYAEPIGLNDIVSEVGVSKSVLYERFHEDVGVPPLAMLTRIRLDKAKRMLCETDAKLYDVSGSCGFGDPINLYRQFKNHLGIGPNEYRKQESKQGA